MTSQDISIATSADSAPSLRWYDIVGLWRAARWQQRVATVVPPFVPLAMFFLLPIPGAGLATLVLLVSATVAVVRLLLQPLRLGEPTPITAWRLPLAALVASTCIFFLIQSHTAATNQARDIARRVQHDILHQGAPIAWPCADGPSCHVDGGLYPSKFRIYLARDDSGTEGLPAPTYTVMVDLGPDTKKTFVIGGDGTLIGRSVVDSDIRGINPDTGELFELEAAAI